MDLFYQILALTLSFVLMFFLVRGVLRIYIDSTLKKRQRKKFAKNQSFSEWFFYKRYKDILTKPKLFLYYSLFVLYVIFLTVIIILYLTGNQTVGNKIIWAYFCFYGLYLTTSRVTLKF